NQNREGSFQDGKEEVLQAWFMDDGEEDHRLPHHCEPKKFVSLDKLAVNLLLEIDHLILPPTDLGIVTWRLNAENHESDEDLKQIREARGCSFMVIDELPLPLSLSLSLSSFIKKNRCFSTVHRRYASGEVARLRGQVEELLSRAPAHKRRNHLLHRREWYNNSTSSSPPTF
ncbi:hypothetical protein BHM03_00062013, partial [Ensete ventricosum]